VFHWLKGNIRRPLEEGETLWGDYIRLLGTGRNFLLEFVREDREDQCIADGHTLRRLTGAS
jgi:hypothetical protein